jgi:hypothetical protein
MNIQSLKKGFPLLMLLIIGTPSQAYEVATHAWLTDQAYSRSQIAQPDRLKEYGIENKDKTFGTDTYIDVHGSTAIHRTRKDKYTDTKINKELDLDAERYTIPGWLMRGGEWGQTTFPGKTWSVPIFLR